MFLLETLDAKLSGVVDQLYSDQVFSAAETGDIIAEMTSFRANEKLLSVLSRKSPQQFQLFLDALDNCGQRRIRNVIGDRRWHAFIHARLYTSGTISRCSGCTLHSVPSLNSVPSPLSSLPHSLPSLFFSFQSPLFRSSSLFSCPSLYPLFRLLILFLLAFRRPDAQIFRHISILRLLYF